MKKFLKEPFLHFLCIGVGLFILYSLVNKEIEDKSTIVINDFDISNLMSTWEMQWKRQPTPKELQNLIGLNIKQEVFYQEALKMNLDHNDEIIKRRLAQKMQFLSKDIASILKPTEEDLEVYLKANKEKYLTPFKYSLYQIIFSPDNREKPFEDALRVLNQFSNASFDEMKAKGDNLPFSYEFENVNADELALQFGPRFPKALLNQKTNKWIGPVPSGFGAHLVFITQITQPELPKLKDIKKQVTRDFEYDYQKELDESIYKELKKQYDIRIEIKSKDFDPDFVSRLQQQINN